MSSLGIYTMLNGMAHLSTRIMPSGSTVGIHVVVYSETSDSGPSEILMQNNNYSLYVNCNVCVSMLIMIVNKLNCKTYNII